MGIGGLRGSMPALSLLVFAAISGCGSEDADKGPVEDFDAVEACGLGGAHRIALAPERHCGDLPQLGERIEVLRSADGDTILRAGTLELAASVEDCVLVAHGCNVETDSRGEATRYTETIATLRREGDALHLDFDVDDVRDHALGECDGAAAYEAAEVEDCDPAGLFGSTGTLTSGTCDFAHSGAITITKADSGYSVELSGTTIDDVTLDRATCTLRGRKGGGAFEAWLYNNTLRALELELHVEGDAITGTITDRVEDETFDGKSCEGGTYTIAGTRDVRVAAPVEPMCSAERPTVCGDGVCDAERDETCGSCLADCGCADGMTCGGAPARCMQPCDLLATAQCGEHERCGDPEDGYLAGYGQKFCVPSLDGQRGQRCRAHGDCADGLVCHVDARRPLLAGEDGGSPVGLCAPPCTLFDATTTCDRGTCSQSILSELGGCVEPCEIGTTSCTGADAICWAQYTGETSGTCVAGPEGGLAGVGEACVFEEHALQCEAGLGCVGSCHDGVCADYCAPECRSESDCPASLPRCSVFSDGIGFCMR